MHPRTLLCERCGYVLDGLDIDAPSAACPECGTAIFASLPERRPGTPWQRSPGFVGWCGATWRGLRSPGAMFRRASVRATDRVLLLINTLLGAGLIAGGIALALVDRVPLPNARPYLQTDPRSLQIALWLLFPLWVLLLALSEVERRGVVFFSRRRRWRVTLDIGMMAVAHAGVGWIIGGLLFAILARWPDTRWLLGGTADVALWNLMFDAHLPIAPFAGWLVGLMVFEVLVYVAVRRCRFANMPTGKRG
jgi:hypothetical protein